LPQLFTSVLVLKQSINGMANDEKGLSFEDFKLAWLSGAQSHLCAEYCPRKKRGSFQLAVTPNLH
jgi:hypothetical protein